MDVVSVVSSIAGLVTLALQIGGALNDYIQAVEGRAFEIESLFREITLLAEVLSQLKDVLAEDSAKGSALDRDCVLKSAIQDCTRRIERIGDKIRPATGGKLARSLDKLKWPFERGEVEKLALGLQRFTQAFSFALTAKGFQVLTKSAQAASANLEQLLDINSKMTAMYEQMQISSVETVKESVQMKEVLALLPMLAEQANDIREMSHQLRLAEEREYDRWKDEILEWLIPRSALVRHAEVSKRRTSSTCTWFERQSDVYQWVRATTKAHDLLCVGNPGVGKTVLAAFMVDELRLQHKDTDAVVLHYYCSHFDEQTSSAIHFARSLLRQLCQSCSHLPSPVADFYRRTKHETDDVLWFQALQETLLRVAATFENIYLVLDAIDEMNTSRSRKALLALLVKLRATGVSMRVMATTRPHISDVEESLQSPVTLPIAASAEDIRMYLLSRIEEDSQADMLIDAGLKADIVHELSCAAKGVFLLPSLQLDQVLQQVSRAGVRRSLANLSSTLDDAFGASLDRIRALAPIRRELASRTLMWVSSVRRPLTIYELQHALSVQDDDKDLDMESIVDERLIVENCSGLIELDKETCVVKLVHLSLEEYLLSHDHGLFQEADAQIARTCLKYITYPSVRPLTAMSRARFTLALNGLPLLRYAAAGWAYHARKTNVGSYADLAIEAFGKGMNMLAVTRARDFETVDDRKWLERASSWAFSKGVGVSLCSSFGLIDLLRILLLSTDVSDLDKCRNSWGNLPLHEAARSGYSQICELLVVHGADVMARNKSKATPFYLAIAQGHLETAILLLKYNRAALDTHCRQGWTALHKAVDSASEELVVFLLQAGALYAAMTDDGSTALHICCKHGNLNLATLLVQAGSNVNADSADLSPIDLAALSGNSALVEFLLDKGAKADEVSRDRWTTLMRACRSGHAAVVSVLLKHGARVDFRDKKKMSCLHVAARSGSTETVKAILQHCDDPVGMLQQKDGRNSVPREAAFFCAHFALHKYLRDLEQELLSAKPEQQQTPKSEMPIFLAIEAHDLRMVKSILEKKPRLIDNQQETQQLLPIHVAFIENVPDIVSYLLDQGASISSRGYHGWEPLHIAASVASIRLIELALQRGADIDSVTDTLQTPLHKVTSTGSLKALLVLLEAGANARATNERGMTALHVAASNGFTEGMAELLKPKWNAEDALSVRDRNGKFPRDWAEVRGQIEAVNFLRTREKLSKKKGRVEPDKDDSNFWSAKTHNRLKGSFDSNSRPSTPSSSLSRAETLVDGLPEPSLTLDDKKLKFVMDSDTE